MSTHHRSRFARLQCISFVLVGAGVPAAHHGGPLSNPRGQIPMVENLRRAVHVARRNGHDLFVYVVDPNLTTPESSRYIGEFAMDDRIRFIPNRDDETKLDIPGGYVFTLTYTGTMEGEAVKSYGRGTLAQVINFDCDAQIPDLELFTHQIFHAIDHDEPAKITPRDSHRSFGNGIPQLVRGPHVSKSTLNVVFLGVPSGGQTYSPSDINEAVEYLSPRGFNLKVIFVCTTQTWFVHPSVEWIETTPQTTDLSLRGETMIFNFDHRDGRPNTLRLFDGRIVFESFFNPNFRFHFRTFFGVKFGDSRFDITNPRHWSRGLLPKESVEWLIGATQLFLELNAVDPSLSHEMFSRMRQEVEGNLIYFTIRQPLNFETVGRTVKLALYERGIGFDALELGSSVPLLWNHLYNEPRGL